MSNFNITPIVGREYFIQSGYIVEGDKTELIRERTVRVKKVLSNEAVVVEFFDNPDCTFEKTITSGIFYEV